MSTHHKHDTEQLPAAVEVRRPRLSEERLSRFEGYAAEILTAYGLNLDTAATRETPRRFIQALFDATEGYDGDPKLLKVFQTECRGGPDCLLSQVIEGPIHWASYGVAGDSGTWLHCSIKATRKGLRLEIDEYEDKRGTGIFTTTKTETDAIALIIQHIRDFLQSRYPDVTFEVKNT